MKKKMIVVLVALYVLSISLSGCSDEDETNNIVNVNENTVVDNN